MRNVCGNNGQWPRVICFVLLLALSGCIGFKAQPKPGNGTPEVPPTGIFKPVNLTVEAVSPTQINVSWNAYAKSNHYRLSYVPGSVPPVSCRHGVKLNVTGNPGSDFLSVSIPNLISGQHYSFRVCASGNQPETVSPIISMPYIGITSPIIGLNNPFQLSGVCESTGRVFVSLNESAFVRANVDDSCHDGIWSHSFGALPKVQNKVKLLVTALGSSTMMEIEVGTQVPTYAFTRTVQGTGQGDNSNQVVTDSVADGPGNLYILGTIKGDKDLDPTAATLQYSGPKTAVFLTKYSKDGLYLWTKLWQNSQKSLHGSSIALDTNSNIYITGTFNKTVDFDPGPGVSELTAPSGPTDTFIVKLDSGGDFIWAMKTTGNGSFSALTTDSDDNFYLVSLGQLSATKYTEDGTFLWNFDGSNVIDTSNSAGHRVSTDSLGNLYVAGTCAQGIKLASESSWTACGAFILQLASDGTLNWNKSFMNDPIPSNRSLRGLAVDSANAVLVVGSWKTTSTDFDPGVGIDTHSSAGLEDVFVTKFSNSGNYVWTRTLGGQKGDEGYAVGTNSTDDVFITGKVTGKGDLIDFDSSQGEDIIQLEKEEHTFISKFNSAGDYQWTKLLGGDSQGTALCVDGADNVFVTGSLFGTDATDFDPSPAVELHSADASESPFLSKFSQ